MCLWCRFWDVKPKMYKAYSNKLNIMKNINDIDEHIGFKHFDQCDNAKFLCRATIRWGFIILDDRLTTCKFLPDSSMENNIMVK